MASLNPNELEIMRILWEHGSLKPAEIQRRLSHPIKNSALRWQLAELMEKAQVTRRKQGKAYRYRATTPRQNVFQRLTHKLAEALCGGSAVALIGQMIESQEELSEEDIRELRRIAARKVSAKKSSGKKGAER
jgi:predicted transcriptional regulator